MTASFDIGRTPSRSRSAITDVVLPEPGSPFIPSLLPPGDAESQQPECEDRRRSSAETGRVLRVLCSESELGEYGETIAVGGRVSRLAARAVHAYYGTELDAVEWRFDQYAGAVGYEAATITGTVRTISAIYVEMTQLRNGTWTATRGTAHLEPLTTTAATRRPDGPFDWRPPSALTNARNAYRAGRRHITEGDERLSGWVITLENEAIRRG